MFKLLAELKGLDGIKDSSGQFWDLVLVPAENSGSVQIFCGSSVSYDAAKTLAGTIFKASLTWDDTAHETAAFTA